MGKLNIKNAMTVAKGAALGGPTGAALAAGKTLLDDDDDDKKSGGGGGKRGLHSWQGPRRQALGGVGFGYDWRPVEPLRPTTFGGSPGGADEKEEAEEEPGSDPMFTHPLEENFQSSQPGAAFQRPGQTVQQEGSSFQDEWASTASGTITPTARGINGSYGTDTGGHPKRSGSRWAGVSADLASAPGSRHGTS